MKRRLALSALLLPLVPRTGYAQGKAPIKVGFTLALSGPFAGGTAEYLPAYELGIAEVNSRGGIKGREVKMQVEDTAGTPQAGVASMRKLSQVDGVAGIVSQFTNVITAQIPLAEQLQMPVVGVLEAPNVVNNAAYVFAHGSRTAKTDEIFARYWQKHGIKRIFAFLANNATGQLVATSVKEQARSVGAEIEVTHVNLADADFRGEITRAREWKPEAMYLQTAGSAADGAIIRQARELGLMQQFFVSSNLYGVRSWRLGVGPYTEGLMFGGPNLDRSLKIANDFVRAYRTKMGYEPGYVHSLMFDAGRILCYGLSRGEGGAAARDAIAKMTGLPSPMGGELSMGADHYTTIPSIAVWRVKNGVEVKVT